MTWPVSNPVARELDDFWKESQALWQQYWYEADLDTKMMTGQQDYWNTFYNINYRNQKILMFNKILRIINMIGGYQRNNRLATTVIPQDNDLDNGETAEQYSTVLNWCMRQDNTYEKISDCFDGSNTCGLNLLHVWMDYREDPQNGMIRTDRIPFNAFLMDNYWTKQDLSDCNRIWTRKYVNRRQLKSLFPDVDKEIPALNQGYAAKDGKFQFLAQNWYQYQEPMYSYDEYWVKDYREKRKILDKSTGEVVDWSGNKEQFQYLKSINPNVTIIKTRVPTIKLHILVNNHVMYEETSPWGLDRMPFVPFCCYHFPEVQNYAYRYQGIVRNIRDSQIELNRRRNRLLDVLDAQVQSGLMVKEDALVNPEDAFMQGPGKVIYFKNTANLASDVAPIPAPPVAQGWQELIETLDKEIMSIVGTPEELYGENMTAKDQSGIMMKLKMGAGLISLQNIFDRLNYSQKALGEIMMDLIQNNFQIGKIERIIGKKATDNFHVPGLIKFNITTEEAELTATQRQLQFMQAVFLRSLDIPISNKYLLEKSTLSDKKGIIEDIVAQDKQQAEQQQQMAQAQIVEQQMIGRSLEAKAQMDFAAAKEREARTVADISMAKHHESQAVQEMASAALNNVKALGEINNLEEDRLIKLANFIVDMQMKQQQAAQQENLDSIDIAQGVGATSQAAEESTKNLQA